MDQTKHELLKEFVLVLRSIETDLMSNEIDHHRRIMRAMVTLLINIEKYEMHYVDEGGGMHQEIEE